jgi:hypothetical protein
LFARKVAARKGEGGRGPKMYLRVVIPSGRKGYHVQITGSPARTQLCGAAHLIDLDMANILE